MTPLLMLPALLSAPALAGGGPMNVLVLYNAEDPDAVELTERYLAARGVPHSHACGLSGVDPTADAIGYEAYLSDILDPTLACLDALPQPEEIGFLVIIKGLPYRVDLPAYSASLDAALQVLDARAVADGARLAGQGQTQSSGLYVASVQNPVVATTSGYLDDFTLENPYMGWYISSSGLTRQRSWPGPHDPASLGTSQGWDFQGNLMAVGRLDGFSYADAGALIDRALAAEQATPQGEWLCMEGADQARGARDPECELATRRLAGLGMNATWLSPHDAALSGHGVVAYFTGAAGITGAIDGQTYAPGAIVDNLTSYGAVPNNFRCSEDGATCPASESQTSIARFVRAGATAVHGTVAEPLNNVFPNAAALLLYAAGYSLGEAALYSTWHLYWQNIWLGDPLTTPWRARPTLTLSATEVLPEGLALDIQASHPDGIAELRLYVDGVRVASAAGDQLSVDLDLREGDQAELLAVALSAPATLAPADWNVSEVEIDPAVQGWVTATLTIGEALPDADTDTDTGLGGGADKGRGCATGPARPGALGALLLALVLVRRRMTADARLDRVGGTASRGA
ncbi:MAG: TIGR03790 family protein [Alphaproteobacteria bacterium]|nr:TIGR03790 family protein [Alphaproteobacteria bacterium]MCB9797608.1 TIGR03790 family protein [Alphaproteobacteria bacterium]